MTFSSSNIILYGALFLTGTLVYGASSPRRSHSLLSDRKVSLPNTVSQTVVPTLSSFVYLDLKSERAQLMRSVRGISLPRITSNLDAPLADQELRQENGASQERAESLIVRLRFKAVQYNWSDIAHAEYFRWMTVEGNMSRGIDRKVYSAHFRGLIALKCREIVGQRGNDTERSLLTEHGIYAVYNLWRKRRESYQKLILPGTVQEALLECFEFYKNPLIKATSLSPSPEAVWKHYAMDLGIIPVNLKKKK